MCIELLPPGGYPIAVKYIISYHTDEISIIIQNFIMYEYIRWRNIASIPEIRVNVYMGPLMTMHLIPFTHARVYTLA